MINLTVAAYGVFILLFGLLIAFVIPAVKAKTNEMQMDEINYWIRVAVQAAEQVYKGSGKGAVKKKAVLSFLESKGYTIDFDALDALIESAVYELGMGGF